VLACLAAAVLGTGGTLLLERRHPEPFLALELFRNRVFLSAAATGFFIFMCLFACSAYGPMFVQGVIGENPKWAGLVLMPMSLGWLVCSSCSGFLLLRIGYRALVVAGTLFVGFGFALLLQLDAQTTWTSIALCFATVGCGMGCVAAPMMIAVQNAVPKPQLGAATSLTQFLRQMGGALGLAVMGVLFAERLIPIERKIGMTAEKALGLEVRATLAPDVLEGLRSALAGSIHLVFVVGIVAAAIALVATFRPTAEDRMFR
jgi:predicted MFS family arabinose efflux permease